MRRAWDRRTEIGCVLVVVGVIGGLERDEKERDLLMKEEEQDFIAEPWLALLINSDEGEQQLRPLRRGSTEKRGAII